jgi:hypothetical protein
MVIQVDLIRGLHKTEFFIGHFFHNNR